LSGLKLGQKGNGESYGKSKNNGNGDGEATTTRAGRSGMG
jgi:hypothetical protein